MDLEEKRTKKTRKEDGKEERCGSGGGDGRGGETLRVDCPFCALGRERLVAENALACAFRDGFPVSKLHSLIVSRRHVADWFDLTPEEVLCCNALLHALREDILEKDASVEGFNIGVNCGAVAGQSVFHCHIHLIPRRRGDVLDPKGGVRHLMPGRGYY